MIEFTTPELTAPDGSIVGLIEESQSHLSATGVPRLGPDDPLYPLATEALLAGRRRAAAVLDNGAVIGVLYAAHLEAALRRATAGFGASTSGR